MNSTRKAADIMTRQVVTIGKDAPLTKAIQTLVESKVSCLPVLDENGDLAGIISEYDIINFAFSGNAAETRVEEAMSRNVISFEPETELETIIKCCTTKRIHRVPIVKDRKVVGMLSRRDLLREIERMYNAI